METKERLTAPDDEDVADKFKDDTSTDDVNQDTSNGETCRDGEENEDSAAAEKTDPRPDDEHFERSIFSPPLSMQRYQKVCDLVKEYRVKSVLDLGCGECRLIQKLRNVTFLERITGIDIDKDPLRASRNRCRPLPVDHLCPRSQQLVMELYHGDITQRDTRIVNHEMVTLVEVVEHLNEEPLQKLPEAVFGVLNPKYCVMSTPNSEYNVLFENFEGMRHWDHKFEWTRADFEKWSRDVADKYGYSVEFTGVGDPPEDRAELGFCTQIAIFKRLKEAENSTDPYDIHEVHDRICSETFPFRTQRRILMEKICSEMERVIHDFTEEDQLNEISIDCLCEKSILDEICDRSTLIEILLEVGYKMTKDNYFVIIDTRELWSYLSEDSGGQFSDAEEDASSEITFDTWTKREIEVWD